MINFSSIYITSKKKIIRRIIIWRCCLLCFYFFSFSNFCIQWIYFSTLLKQKYDAVVGDTTIIANRSIYVDFTQPYAESGVSMIVPIQQDEVTKSPWWFTKPFEWKLWLVIFVISIFKGGLILAFEREVNEDFQGPLHKQLGTIFYFSFSLFLFSQRKS